MTKPKVVTLIRCPIHGVEGLCIGQTRITAAKCCGQWREIQDFPLAATGEEIQELLTD